MSKSNRATQTKADVENQNETSEQKVVDKVDAALATLTTTSGKIRYLNSIGWDRGRISKKLGVRYQHVRNVLITPVKTPKEPTAEQE